MKKVSIAMLASFSIVLFICLSISGAGQSNIKINLFQIKYIGFDMNSDTFKLDCNISLNVPGHVTYLEEYYTLYGTNNPKFSTSKTYYDDDLVGDDTGTFFNASFDIFRPDPHGGTTYSLVKSVILLDNKRIYELWLTKNKDFIDNTPTGDNTVSPLQNVDKFETKDGRIIADLPTVFTYTSIDPIYEVNVTGKSNDDISLRVEILKDTPSITYEPNGIVYGYLDTRADSNNIKVLAPKYRIENSWIQNNSITSIGMLMWDNDNKTWIGLHTNVIDKDSKYVYLESTSQISAMFNNFAIVGYIAPPNRSPPNSSIDTTNTTGTNTTGESNQIINTTDEPNTTSDSSQANTTQTDQPDQTGQEPLIKNIPGFQSVLTIVMVIISFIALKKRRK